METLIKGTAAYKIFQGDKRGDRLSHAYMLHFSDRRNLRGALKLFALVFFGAADGSRDWRLILTEGLPDMKVFPEEGKKLTVDDAEKIVDDAVVMPVEKERKLYIISDFDTAAPAFQNKLLKILEEPPEGVYFLLGAAQTSSVLVTVLSRVKTLEIPPFSESQIMSALNRAGDNPLNAQAAKACAGSLGTAQNILDGGWYSLVSEAAEKICKASTVAEAVKVSSEYGDIKWKEELLSEMQRRYFNEVKRYAEDKNYKGALCAGAVIYAAQKINGAFADVKYNANFPSLLYDFTLGVATENEKWKKSLR